MKKVAILIGVAIVSIVISLNKLNAGKMKMVSLVNNEIDALYYNSNSNYSGVISENDIKHLPKLIQDYLKYCNVIEKEKVLSVQLEQEAKIKMKRDKNKWSYHETKQYFNTENPGFIWFAKLPVAFINFLVRDKLLNGQGEMYITIGGAIKLGRETGPEMDYAGVARFMGECVWFPQCFVNEYFTWEELDSTKIKATINFDGFSQEGIFTFNEQNQIVKFECQRYCSWTKQNETYVNYFKNYKEMDGIMIPRHGIAAYEINGEVIEYWRGDLTKIAFNKPIKYIE